jgi:hypothetical protein
VGFGQEEFFLHARALSEEEGKSDTRAYEKKNLRFPHRPAAGLLEMMHGDDAASTPH